MITLLGEARCHVISNPMERRTCHGEKLWPEDQQPMRKLSLSNHTVKLKVDISTLIES